MTDQGFSGLMVQIFQAGGADLEWWLQGSRPQDPTGFLVYAEHDLTHERCSTWP